jgi:hypothetical protein
LPQELSAAEQRFWLACARRMPGSIAYVLNLARPEEIPLAYREPIRAYLEKEIEKPTILENSQAEYDLVASLRVLNRWRMPEDTPLLLSYLRHPCRHTNGIYYVRQHAGALLEERGVKIPADVVYREEPGAGEHEAP